MFSSLKKGNHVVKVITGGGVQTASIQEVEKVDKKTKAVYLKGCDGYYKRDSLYAYDVQTGRACESVIPGFSSHLIYLEE